MPIRRSEPYSVVPIDLGATVDSVKRQTIVRQKLVTNGWSEREMAADLSVNVGHQSFCYAQGSARLFITTFGIAALVLCWQPEDFDAERRFHAVAHCRHRRAEHAAIRGLESGLLPEGFATLILTLRGALRRTIAGGNRRYLHEQVVHYAMTTYFLHDEDVRAGTPLSPSTRSHVALCLNPSRMNLDDSEAALTSAAVGKPIVEFAELIDFDDDVVSVSIDDRCSTYASWAAVIVHGAIDDCTRDIVMGLQIRTQIGWLAAWVTQDVTTSLLNSDSGGVSPRRLSWQQAEMNRLRRLSAARTTSSESSRLRTLRESFEKTSEINEEWARAQEALESAREHATLIASDLDFRRATVLEILLLVISVASLAQVIVPLPITTGAVLMEFWRQLVGLVAIVAVGSVLIVFRRR